MKSAAQAAVSDHIKSLPLCVTFEHFARGTRYYMMIRQSITGQLSKDTLRASHQQMAAQLFKKEDRETNISVVPLPGSHTAHTCMEAVLGGPEYQMELPNRKSPCLNLAGSDVLHYLVTRPLQMPSTPRWRCCINCSSCCPIISHAQGENYSLQLFLPLNSITASVTAVLDMDFKLDSFYIY